MKELRAAIGEAEWPSKIVVGFLVIAVITAIVVSFTKGDGPTYLDATEPDRIHHVCKRHGGIDSVSTDGFDAAVVCADRAYATVESGWDSKVERFPEAKK
jgi:hypothetical protein